MQKVELLAPAGDLEKLKTAVVYGADAVYLGGMQYGLRASAGNFTLEEMQEGISFAHEHGVRVYVTVNILAHNEDLTALPAYITQLDELGIDAVIVADPGVLSIIKEVAPQMEVHLSTQANNTNWRSAQFWADQGVSRIILARELTAAEVKEMTEKAAVDLEVFVHGAMCISYSGRCLLSNYFTGRDANRGECVQACRWKYHLVEETRPNEYHPVYEDERGTYIMNSKDMCLIEHIKELLELGVCSLKIEGRMKSVHYVATVTKIYRQAIDAYYQDPKNYKFRPQWLTELSKPSHRKFFTGFFAKKPGEEAEGQNVASSGYERLYDFIGVVRDYDEGRALIEQRNHFAVGEEVEIMNPQLDNVVFTINSITDQKTGEQQERAPHALQQVYIDVPAPVEPFAILRRPKA